MAIRRISLVNNKIYHIVIRGVNDSLIFKNEKDRYRAIFSLYEFNNQKHVDIRAKREEYRRNKINEGPSFVRVDNRDLLVDIFAFCFMPNHIHLLLRQIVDGGITNFMRKFGTGYASYFNKKYDHRGYVFQGRFKSVHIQSDRQLKVVFSYIHTNPVSLIETKWKESGIKNPSKIINFLEDYKWSSYGDYLEKTNFPSVTKRDFLRDTMGGLKGCKRFVNDWIRHKASIKKGEFGKILLE